MKPENTGELQDTKFKPGQSGNPSGKPKGARNKTTLAIMALLEGEAEELTRKAIELAKEGDMTALRLCLERIAPARKDNPVMFDMPTINAPQDAIGAMSALLQAVARGDISPSEASEVAKLVDIFIKTLESREMEQRIKQLEERVKNEW